MALLVTLIKEEDRKLV